MVFALASTFSGCLETSEFEDPTAQFLAEVSAVDAYLNANKAAIEGTGGEIIFDDAYGLRYILTEMGTELPARNDTSRVEVAYRGFLFDGTKANGSGIQFDQGTRTFALTDVIDGWQLAFTRLPLGTKGKVFIPSYWGYGTQGRSPSIPGNATLVFEIVDFENVQITDKQYARWQTDTTAIENYLETKEITDYDTLTYFDPATVDARKNMGIRYKIQTEGTGPTITWFDDLKIKIKYRTITADDKIINSNYNDVITTKPVDQIPGVRAALLTMKQGGKGTFYIPSGLGFGPRVIRDSATGTILVPANANLIVDLEVVDVVE